MFFWRLLFQIKKLLTFAILNESNIWAEVDHIEKKWGIGRIYCWNYGSSKLLLHFIEYRLDQLEQRLEQTHQYSSKLGNAVFWRLLSKEMSAKSLKFFGPPTTKWRPCKIFAKLNGNHLLMANIFKLHEYQTFGLMKMHNMCKIWFANKIFSLWKSLVYD